MRYSLLIGALVVILGGMLIHNRTNQFPIPSGETQTLSEESPEIEQAPSSPLAKAIMKNEAPLTDTPSTKTTSGTRELLETNGIKHSIPLNEILSGGPAKDGIPSIDAPEFISIEDAREFLTDTDVGLGFVYNGETRFYPYQILVWHEIVNDTIGGKRVLVTYCPLCATGVVFDPTINGVQREFGVSGKLWQSNLLMYDRTGDATTESLWSQVLGEAVLGPKTGTRLSVLRADTVQFGTWVKNHPETTVLSRETGATRRYGGDPYGDYYTNESVSFGATFSDDRLHPKSFVLGIEIDGKYTAYEKDALVIGETKDTFNGKEITINKTTGDEVTMTIAGDELEYIGGFWFSWLAVHPDTELWTTTN